MSGFVKRTFATRLQGDRPSLVRALAVATLVGVAAAVAAYKLMRMRT